MKIVSDKLYIEFQEFQVAGVPKGTLDSYKQRGVWSFIDDPEDKRRLLIDYQSLKPKYKELIERHFGNPYVAESSKIIDKYLSGKPEDIDFLSTYKLPDGRNIPAPTLERYINDVKVLHFATLTETKQQLNAIGIPDKPTLWKMLSAVIKRMNCTLPTDRARLQGKIAEYKTSGPQIIISKAFCNACAKKVNDEISEAYLLELLRQPNQFNSETIAIAYSSWAAANGHRGITGQTVLNYYNRNRIYITAQREGLKVWQNQYEPVRHRERPSAPLLLINSDDNELDLYFHSERKDKHGKIVKTAYARVKVIIVTDAYNDYPLGYAMTDGDITVDLVRHAYLNAIHHIYNLTGGFYLPHQLQADAWAKTQLFPWYSKIGSFIPSRIGNSRARRIEQSFGNSWHELLKRYSNYSGHNIDAKTKPNLEALKSNNKEFPHISEAPAQVAHFIESLRKRITKKGTSVEQQWLSAWEQMPQERRRPLADSQRLLLFGMQTKRPSTITNSGLVFQLEGSKLFYFPSHADYLKHVHRTLNVAYDPYKMDQVLAFSDDESIQVVCDVAEKYRDAISDMLPGDRQRLNVRLQADRELSQWATQTIPAKQQQALQQNNLDVRSQMLHGNFSKEARQLAEGNYRIKQLNTSDELNDEFSKDDPIAMNLPQSTDRIDQFDEDEL